MRLTFAFLACLAIASASYNGQESSFEPNKAYHFKYEAQVITGLRDAGKYISAFKIESTCIIQFNGGNQAVAQLQNLQFLRTVDRLPEEMSAHTMLPENMVRPIDDQDVQEELKAQMSRPFKFAYVNGEVSNIECEESEPYWSLNLKKGLLNIMEMKLRNYQDMRSGEEDQIHPEIREAYSRNEVNTQDRQEKTFIVEENGIEGICKTTYTIIHQSGGIKKVIKVKDLNECREKPYYMTGLLTTLKPEQCERQEKSDNPLLKPTNVETVAEYKIKGDGRQFLIMEALYKSQYVAAPFNIKSGIIASFTTQKLILTNVNSERSIREPSSNLRQESLKLNIPKDISSHQTYSMSSKTPVQATKSKVLDLLSRIVSESKPQVSVDALYKMVDLLSILRELPKETLKELINEVHHKQREILLDLIPAVTSPTIFPLIKDLISERKITDLRALVMMRTHVMVAPPSVEAIDALLSLCPRGQRCGMAMKTNSLLNIGIIAGKIYKMRDVLPIDQVQNVLQRVETELKSELSQASDVHFKSVILKSMQNSGMPCFLPLMEKIIFNENENTNVREVAIRGLQNYTHMAPLKVREICLPLYLDTTNPIPLRTACIPIILSSKPRLSELTLVTSSLNKEPSMDVASAVFTYLTTQAKSTCNYQMARKIKAALLITKPAMPELLGSGAVDLEVKHEKSRIGAVLAMFAEKYDNTVIPNEFIVRFSTLWDDIFVETFMAGVRMSGLRAIEERLIGEQGLLMQLVKKQITPQEAVKQVLRMVREGGYETAPQEMKQFSVFIKLFANEIFHIDINNRNIDQIIEHFQQIVVNIFPVISGRHTFDLIKPILNMHTSYLIPTPMGMPVSLNTTTITALGAYGEINLEGLVQRSDLITITKNVEASTASIFVFDFGVHLPMIRTGYALSGRSQGKLPINGVTRINKDRLTIQSTMDTPRGDLELFKFEVKPIAFFMKAHIESSRDAILRDDVVDSEIAVLETESYDLGEWLGYGVRVDSKRMVPKWKDVQVMPVFMGKNSLKIVLSPRQNGANQMEFKMVMLCPNCVMTEAEKDQWLFETNQAVAQEHRGGWGLWRSTPTREIGEISFDRVQPDPSFVDPSMKYYIAAVLKMKQSSQDNLIAGQLCFMNNNILSKFQIDSQLISPTWNARGLTKTKLITKFKIPDYILNPTAGSLRQNDQEEICHTELYIGEVSHPQKIMDINTQLRCLKCDWHEMPKQYSPVQLITRFTPTGRIPTYAKNIVKKALTWVKNSDRFFWMNYAEFEDIITMSLSDQGKQEIWMETNIIPMEYKVVLKLRLEDQYVKAKVCPFTLPWSVPKKPINKRFHQDSNYEQNQLRHCTKATTTKIIPRTMGNTEYFCFSRDPIETCVGGCRHPDHVMMRDVSFICKPRHSMETERLIERVRAEPLSQLTAGWEDSTIYEQVAIPLYCEAL